MKHVIAFTFTCVLKWNMGSAPMALPFSLHPHSEFYACFNRLSFMILLCCFSLKFYHFCIHSQSELSIDFVSANSPTH